MESVLNWIVKGSAVVLAAVSLYHLSKIAWWGIRRILSRGWPVTTAAVIDTNIGEKFSLLNFLMGSSEKLYVPEIQYTYSVMGTPYKNGLSLEGRWGEPLAEKFLSEIGDRLVVRYHPGHPSTHITAEEKIRLEDLGGVVVPFAAWLFLLYLMFGA